MAQEPAPEFTMPITTTTREHREVLAQSSQPVDSHTEDLAPLLTRMYHAMKNAHGDGMAAIQIGVPKRAFLFLRPGSDEDQRYQTAINPEILSASETTQTTWDGCLSVPEGIGRVTRHASITVRYENEQAVVKTETLEGLAAIIFQHEMDHLNGRLFTHYLPNAKLIPHREFFDLFDDLEIECENQRLSASDCRALAERAWHKYQRTGSTKPGDL